MLKAVHNNASRFGVDESKVRPFEKLIIELEGQVLTNDVIFSVSSNFDDSLFGNSQSLGWSSERSIILSRTVFG